MKVCVLCGGEAEYHEADQVWRHKGNPWERPYMNQQFCDRYGYPIPVKDEVEKIPVRWSKNNA